VANCWFLRDRYETCATPGSATEPPDARLSSRAKRLPKLTAILQPSTVPGFHQALVKRKHQMFHFRGRD
jgi:hypothetical protein